ncbi:hypothetical protein SNEBB_011233 [Seison nebaliae]|nr:hypothetical protein SNEBB_011233 [Seison nebaliae]
MNSTLRNVIRNFNDPLDMEHLEEIEVTCVYITHLIFEYFTMVKPFQKRLDELEQRTTCAHLHEKTERRSIPKQRLIPHDKKFYSEAQLKNGELLQILKIALYQALRRRFSKKFASHWYPNEVDRGSGYRCCIISSDKQMMDPCISGAMKEIGLNPDSLAKLLYWNLSFELCGDKKMLYEIKPGKVNKSELYGENFIDGIDDGDERMMKTNHLNSYVVNQMGSKEELDTVSLERKNISENFPDGLMAPNNRSNSDFMMNKNNGMSALTQKSMRANATIFHQAQISKNFMDCGEEINKTHLRIQKQMDRRIQHQLEYERKLKQEKEFHHQNLMKLVVTHNSHQQSNTNPGYYHQPYNIQQRSFSDQTHQSDIRYHSNQQNFHNLHHHHHHHQFDQSFQYDRYQPPPDDKPCHFHSQYRMQPQKYHCQKNMTNQFGQYQSSYPPPCQQQYRPPPHYPNPPEYPQERHSIEYDNQSSQTKYFEESINIPPPQIVNNYSQNNYNNLNQTNNYMTPQYYQQPNNQYHMVNDNNYRSDIVSNKEIMKYQELSFPLYDNKPVPYNQMNYKVPPINHQMTMSQSMNESNSWLYNQSPMCFPMNDQCSSQMNKSDQNHLMDISRMNSNYYLQIPENNEVYPSFGNGQTEESIENDNVLIKKEDEEEFNSNQKWPSEQKNSDFVEEFDDEYHEYDKSETKQNTPSIVSEDELDQLIKEGLEGQYEDEETKARLRFEDEIKMNRLKEQTKETYDFLQRACGFNLNLSNNNASHWMDSHSTDLDGSLLNEEDDDPTERDIRIWIDPGKVTIRIMDEPDKDYDIYNESGLNIEHLNYSGNCAKYQSRAKLNYKHLLLKNPFANTPFWNDHFYYRLMRHNCLEYTRPDIAGTKCLRCRQIFIEQVNQQHLLLRTSRNVFALPLAHCRTSNFCSNSDSMKNCMLQHLTSLGNGTKSQNCRPIEKDYRELDILSCEEEDVNESDNDCSSTDDNYDGSSDDTVINVRKIRHMNDFMVRKGTLSYPNDKYRRLPFDKIVSSVFNPELIERSRTLLKYYRKSLVNNYEPFSKQERWWPPNYNINIGDSRRSCVMNLKSEQSLFIPPQIFNDCRSNKLENQPILYNLNDIHTKNDCNCLQKVKSCDSFPSSSLSSCEPLSVTPLMVEESPTNNNNNLLNISSKNEMNDRSLNGKDELEISSLQIGTNHQKINYAVSESVRPHYSTQYANQIPPYPSMMKPNDNYIVDGNSNNNNMNYSRSSQFSELTSDKSLTNIDDSPMSSMRGKRLENFRQSPIDCNDKSSIDDVSPDSSLFEESKMIKSSNYIPLPVNIEMEKSNQEIYFEKPPTFSQPPPHQPVSILQNSERLSSTHKVLTSTDLSYGKMTSIGRNFIPFPSINSQISHHPKPISNNQCFYHSSHIPYHTTIAPNVNQINLNLLLNNMQNQIRYRSSLNSLINMDIRNRLSNNIPKIVPSFLPATQPRTYGMNLTNNNIISHHQQHHQMNSTLMPLAQQILQSWNQYLRRSNNSSNLDLQSYLLRTTNPYQPYRR